MRLHRVLLACKKTAYEYYCLEQDEIKKSFMTRDLQILQDSHQSHYSTVEYIKGLLREANIDYKQVFACLAQPEQFEGYDLIISIGGDGTLLASASRLYSTPVLPVKSDSRSCGALCSCTRDNFSDILKKILAGESVMEKWTRIEGRMGNKTQIALNEIFIGPKYRPQPARYEISMNGIEERQSSSGIIISTGAGSTGWYANVLGSDGSFARTSSQYRFIVTEYNTQKNYRMIKGTLFDKEILKIRSIMNLNGIVSFDGDIEKRLYPFYRGQTIEIKISDNPLCVIVK